MAKAAYRRCSSGRSSSSRVTPRTYALIWLIAFSLFGIVLSGVPVFAQIQASLLPVCRSEQMKASNPDGPEGGLGHFAYVYQVTNSSKHSCTLRGVPRLRLLDELGRQSKLTICANCADYIFPVRPIETITVRPGESAHILVGMYTGDVPDRACQTISTIELMPGGSGRPMAFKLGLRGCGQIDVSAWRAGVYTDQELLSNARLNF